MKTAPKKRKTKPERRRNQDGRNRYYLARWSRLRAYVLARDNHICQVCGDFGNHADHKVPWEDDDTLFWDQDNVQTLCAPCHTLKTRRENNG